MSQPTFKILQPLTCGFVPPEVRAASEFPTGTDFTRLVELGVVRPTGLGAMPQGADGEKYAMLETIEELQLDLIQAKDEHQKQVAERDATISDLQKQVAELQAAIQKRDLDAASALAGETTTAGQEEIGSIQQPAPSLPSTEKPVPVVMSPPSKKK